MSKLLTELKRIEKLLNRKKDPVKLADMPLIDRARWALTDAIEMGPLYDVKATGSLKQMVNLSPFGARSIPFKIIKGTNGLFAVPTSTYSKNKDEFYPNHRPASKSDPIDQLARECALAAYEAKETKIFNQREAAKK